MNSLILKCRVNCTQMSIFYIVPVLVEQSQFACAIGTSRNIKM
uniref:Uncharacterized protein n=1 Tax=Anguilla anguilla TaxID=7936 RepID=A0A0E9SZQ6_ANGAN